MAGDNAFDGVFWITISGAIIGFLGLAIKQCFKSKCSSVRLCFGLINIQRDVNAEEKIEEYQIDHGIINNQSSRNNASIQPSNNNNMIGSP